jgi:Fic family protein
MASSSLPSEVYKNNDYALNSGFVSSIDSSTEIENDEISPANFRHDLRKLLGVQQTRFRDIPSKPYVCRRKKLL